MSEQHVIVVSSVADIQAAVRTERRRLAPRGGGSKPALCGAQVDGAVALDLSALSGILEYEPGEFTFTAQAATPLTLVQAALAEHGQSLPFDPPLAGQGATLGGTVAAGLSGPGRQRYGGVRDFLIGVRFVDGQGQLVRGGGKVVKNAAGFDFPKLMVGSLGRLGILVELTFKVFPQPPAFLSVRAPALHSDAARAHFARLATAPFDLEALDYAPDEQAVVVRLGGLPAVLPQRAQRLAEFLGGGEIAADGDEAEWWRQQRELAWAPADAILVKIPLAPPELPALEVMLAAANAQRHYSAGGSVAWVAWPGRSQQLDAELRRLNLSGLAIRGDVHQPLLGGQSGAAFLAKVKQALDPQARFLDYDV